MLPVWRSELLGTGLWLSEKLTSSAPEPSGELFDPPDTFVGETYNYVFPNAEGLVSPFTLSGFLPNGLSLNLTTGDITGAALMAYTFPYIAIKDATGQTLYADITVTEPAGSPVAVDDAYTVSDGTPLVVTGTGALTNDTYT